MTIYDMSIYSMCVQGASAEDLSLERGFEQVMIVLVGALQERVGDESIVLSTNY